MDCPKCGHALSASAIECSACGIIVSRYSASRDRWMPPPPPPPEPKKDSGNGVLVVFGLVFLALVGAGVYVKKTGAKLPPWLEDALGAVLLGVLIVAVVIYKFMVVKNVRL
ncbi:MAG TPA: zinc ribbon domain-containing protein [Thermoanaerobaculia bacterium]|nr:zinc ribbon domain-containing protein [Thermoanaerobaculia bacterium]